MDDYSKALDVQMDLVRVWSDEEQLKFERRHMTLDERGVEHLLTSAVRSLRLAQTFFVTDHICDFLAATTPQMLVSPLYRELLPCPAGFVYFDRPFVMPDPATPEGIIGLSWMPCRQSDAWSTRVDLEEADSILFILYRIDRTGGQMPSNALPWKIGETQDDVRADNEYREVRRLEANLALGLLTFLGQKILITDPQRPARSTRRRAERANWEISPLVTIIEYRRRDYRPVERQDAESEREYHVRWIVGAGTGGFWRHYYTRQGYEARFILPYEAGDPSLPLKTPRATINVVRR